VTNHVISIFGGKGMDSLLGKLAAIQKFLKVLTWTKIAQTMAFLFVLGLAWSAYETRQSIYNFASQSKIATRTSIPVKLSKKTTDSIIATVDKSDLIVAMQVTIVDFQKNTRTMVFTYTDDENIRLLWAAFEEKGLNELPLFNTDLVNNQRMVDLINGEFICNPFTTTIGYKISPFADKYISTVCANGIPPFYGKFTGIVSVYTKRTPTPEEVDQIRTLTKSLSATIYDRDIK
jgi:hypothetical protein